MVFTSKTKKNTSGVMLLLVALMACNFIKNKEPPGVFYMLLPVKTMV